MFRQKEKGLPPFSEGGCRGVGEGLVLMTAAILKMLNETNSAGLKMGTFKLLMF